MEDFLMLVGTLGAPVAGALAMGFFIFLVIKQILQGIVDQIETLTAFCKSLQFCFAVYTLLNRTFCSCSNF